ncbi:MAG: hypothetical protein M1817_001038 [Caeruleum heppii]|nr:MAG: hypothetical protein M1817_001038 [Caeruleum heppii]
MLNLNKMKINVLIVVPADDHAAASKAKNKGKARELEAQESSEKKLVVLKDDGDDGGAKSGIKTSKGKQAAVDVDTDRDAVKSRGYGHESLSSASMQIGTPGPSRWYAEIDQLTQANLEGYAAGRLSSDVGMQSKATTTSGYIPTSSSHETAGKSPSGTPSPALEPNQPDNIASRSLTAIGSATGRRGIDLTTAAGYRLTRPGTSSSHRAPRPMCQHLVDDAASIRCNHVVEPFNVKDIRAIIVREPDVLRSLLKTQLYLLPCSALETLMHRFTGPSAVPSETSNDQNLNHPGVGWRSSPTEQEARSEPMGSQGIIQTGRESTTPLAEGSSTVKIGSNWVPPHLRGFDGSPVKAAGKSDKGKGPERPAIANPSVPTAGGNFHTANNQHTTQNRNNSRGSFGSRRGQRGGRGRQASRWPKASETRPPPVLPVPSTASDDGQASEGPSKEESAHIWATGGKSEATASATGRHELADWNGRLMPAPVEWDTRGSWQDPKFRTNIIHWLIKESTTGNERVDTKDERYTRGDDHVEGFDFCAPPEQEETLENPEKNLKVNQTALNAIQEEHISYLNQKLSKKQQKMMRRAQLKAQRALAYTAYTNPHAPKINIYVRPARREDMTHCLDIYRRHSEVSVIVPDKNPRSYLSMVNHWEDVQRTKLPWLVAVRELRGGHGPVSGIHETILGYGLADDRGDPDNAYRYTVDIQFYTHPDFLRLGVGKVLMDKLLDLLDMGYNQKGGYGFYQGPDEKWVTGGIRIIKQILCEIPFPSKKPEEVEWMKAWFDKFEFDQVGHLKQVGHKFEQWIDTLLMQRTTNAEIYVRDP